MALQIILLPRFDPDDPFGIFNFEMEFITKIGSSNSVCLGTLFVTQSYNRTAQFKYVCTQIVQCIPPD